MTGPAAHLRQRLALGARALPRPSAAWLAVRLLAWGTGAGALLLALPGVYSTPTLVVVALLATMAAALPGTVAVLVMQVLAVGGWLFVTWVLAEQVSPVRVLALAAALYLHHVVCAFAAVLPVSAALSPAVLARALSRTAVVAAISVAVGATVFAAATWLSADSPLLAPLAGLVAAITLAALLVHLLHRRS